MSRLKTDAIRNVNASVDGITLDTSGNVAIPNKIGINTTSPEDLLHIKTGKIRIENAIVSNNDSTISYDNDTFLVDVDPNNVRGSSQFQIKIDTVSGLIIDDNRRVGIGTTSPRTKLDVTGYIYSNNGSQIQITGNPGSKGLQLIGQDDGTSLIGTMGSSGEHLLFRTASSERMRLLVGGSHLLLGGSSSVNEITESSANAGMVIGGTGFGNGGLAIINSTSGTGRIYFGDAVGSSAARHRGLINYYHNGDFMMFGTAGSERLRIDSSGKVGIGTGVPEELLHIRDASAPAIQLEAYSGGPYKSLIKMGGNDMEIRGSNGNIEFFTGNADGDSSTERLRIAPDGRLLLGTQKTFSSQGYYDDITINNSDNASGSAGGTGISLISGNNTWGAILFGDSDDHDVGYIKYAHNGNYMRFATGGSIRARLDSDGLKFHGDTATANGLNDYEEGSWTPTLHDGTCGSSNARYVKIGRQVTVWALCDNFSDRTTNDEVKIGGLPFNSESNGAKGSCMYRFCDESARTTIYMNSSNQMFLYGGETGNYTQVRHNELNSSNFEVYLMATYDAD